MSFCLPACQEESLSKLFTHLPIWAQRKYLSMCDTHSKSRNKLNRRGVGLLLGLLVTFVEYIASTNAPSWFCFFLNDCLSQSRLKKYDLLQFALPLKREKFRLVALKPQQHLLSSCFFLQPSWQMTLQFVLFLKQSFPHCLGDEDTRILASAGFTRISVVSW